MPKYALLAAAIAGLSVTTVHAQEKVLNLYSSRHYQTDEALFSGFEKATGIKINYIQAGEDALLERLKSEGANSPADVFITVDASRLAKADELGLFAPVKSKQLEDRIPAHLRTGEWFSFSQRARVIVYNPRSVKAADVQSYEQLADPKLKGQVCVRSGSHPYNLSLGAALIAHDGEAKTEAWARGLVANFARAPKGGDTDQIKAVAAGECGVALANSYYVARLMRSDKAEDLKVAESIAVVWPNQQSWGTHINVSGGGMLKHAPNKESAVKLLEYLASDAAQVYFADGNNEWPTVPTVKVSNPALDKLGAFKADTLPIGQTSKGSATAQKIFDRAGWR
ncbi:MAG: Fe(3+) ABC transporter substrate-binding protein [Candidatus Dactylopiibacterium carminicum]|uniref:Fe(3+) ABC transporter substrate-binding protein n=1 Tax=Candidatus Dactylopiibacterium carminicum TaxID=857335 RepID=A0A272EQJ6_9RHOO|nr:Fe(3+) ABC transporter substrate-binding protein [Candidatus Dactylopiibacterium carminicum]KAF7598611.1 Fe(3+) ABC transporter substrate-binding protein [Candidatus Dactylopiibacterium carminicum]PAS92364.1 MAG: Fe(3+) ABC transporter substrate-binding protein [Candidatus Dactylopiibacterium carminicum]PAS95810.1 MAG: Fe(3+) ABC transporter substrate-binding protein [Candidatus Dactylopiibacterium carminicum]PAS98376.1 MAG: Fe(3+) ABC transporter substrate-binding protein [Candidatus Dactyl